MKTYAFYDMIGIKELIRNGSANEKLNEFWKCAQSWAIYGCDVVYSNAIPVGATHTEIPECQVATFSDSAVMTTKKEFQFDVFFALATNLLRKFQQISERVYCIISQGEDIPAQSNYLPSTGDDQQPAYYHLAGSGEAWANLFYADSAISKNESWHSKGYDLYVTGELTVPSGYQQAESITYTDILGHSQTVSALLHRH